MYYVAGCFGEWKGILVRDFSFLLDMLTLLTALGHYLIIWWLHGLGFHLLDAVLFMNLRVSDNTFISFFCLEFCDFSLFPEINS